MWITPWAKRRDGHVEVETLALAALRAGTEPDSASPAERAHLEECAECARRLATLEGSLAEARADLAREADALFTDRRLARQQAAILRRLDPDAEPARLLTFPSVSGFPRPVRTVARRWVAAAAVVGLVSGLAAGRFLGHRQTIADPGVMLGSQPGARPGAPVAAARTAAFDPSDDEQFLVELDAALRAPRIEPLRTIEALTPRVVDLAAPPR